MFRLRPAHLTTLTLFGIYLTSLWRAEIFVLLSVVMTEMVRAALIFVGLTLVLGITWWRNQATYRTDIFNTLIAFLILLSIADPTLVWWQNLTLGILLGLAKTIFRTRLGPIANPVAMTLVVGGLLFRQSIDSWWGMFYSPLLLTLPFGVITLANILLAAGGSYEAWSYKKIPIALLTIMGVLAVSAAKTGSLPVSEFFEGTLLYFALVMAIEPKTSPVLIREQIAFALGIGMLTLLFPLLTSLVLANIAFTIWRWRAVLQRKMSEKLSF